MLTFSTYIIRLYRFNRDDPDELLGIVEEVSSGTQKPFKNIKELWNIITFFEHQSTIKKNNSPPFSIRKRK